LGLATPAQYTDSVASAIISTLCAVALMMVIIRLISRQIGAQNFTSGWDDCLVVVSWLLAFPLTITAGYLSNLGIGRDIWNFPLDKLTDLFLFIYIESLVYIVATGVTKLAFVVSKIPQRTARH
jgi:hypothetical protein